MTTALSYGEPAGEPELREAIAGHLAVTRGVRCKPSQVIVTDGVFTSIATLLGLLIKPGETVWIEDPGYWGARASFLQSGLSVCPIPVDGEGIAPKQKDWEQSPPKLIYTTPGHQYPTGVELSLARRMALINSANKHNTWILEDDYGSDLHQQGKSLPAMQGIARNSSVIYIGSYSKTMFPALRIGYFILPEKLLPQMNAILMSAPRGGSRLAQLMMAEFICSGNYARHLIKMRTLYRIRQSKLIKTIARHIHAPYQIAGEKCGLDLTIILPETYPDTLIATKAREYGLSVLPISPLVSGTSTGINGIVLGYGNTSPDLYDRLIAQLALIINPLFYTAGRLSHQIRE